MKYRSGCALWGFKGWVGELYPPSTPQDRFLERYVERFTAVEGNTFFYATQGPETLERWASSMPEGFHILPKLPRTVTHEGDLRENIPRALRFAERVRHLGHALGPCFALFPPSFGPSRRGALMDFLTAWPRESQPLALELRHPDWFKSEHRKPLDAALLELGVGVVLMDARAIYAGDPDNGALHEACKKPSLPVVPRATAPVIIIRFVGHPEASRNAPYLADWVDFVRVAADRPVDVYFFAHCPEERYSPEIARIFHRKLEEAGVELPPLPWDSVPPIPKQGALF